MAITRGGMAAVAAAAAIAAALLAPAAIASTLTVPADTAPPAFGDVAHCHVEQVSRDAAAITAKCAMPAHADSVTPLAELARDVAIPPAMQGGTHSIEWKSADGALKLAKSGISLAGGIHEARWTVTDGDGNVSTTEQVIIVEDTMPPAFKPGIATTYEMEAATPSTALVAAAFGIQATDSVGVAGTISPSVGSVKVGTHTVKWTAKDAATNRSTLTQTVTVRDTTDPVITTCPPNYTVEATGNPTALTARGAGVAATDNGTEADDIRISPSVPTIALDASAPVRWTATDGVGRTAYCIQLLTVRDRTAPSIFPDPFVDKTIYTTGTSASITEESVGVYAIDHHGIDADPNMVPDETSLGLGTHEVTWTASDSSLNERSKSHNITVLQSTFRVTSLALRDKGIDITFSEAVNGQTTNGIKISKWGQIYVHNLQTTGLLSTTTTTGNVVRVMPTYSSSNENGFCARTSADTDTCVHGSFTGPWVVSLPGTISSTAGERLYTGDTPTLETCAGSPGAQPLWLGRGIANVKGCVGYVNNPSFPDSYRGPSYVIWNPSPPPASSSPVQPLPRLAPHVSAALAAGTDSISLDWSRGSLPLATYAVEKSVNNGAFATAPVILLNATRATAAITAADLGSSLSYRVAETLNGVTTRSDAASVSLPAELEAPRNLIASRPESGSSITLDWREAPIASGYHVERSISGGSFERIATVAQSSHTIEGATPTGSHAFRVVAYLGDVTSPPSPPASVSVPQPPA
ncbi:MAG: hypothetical protein OXU37_07775 [Thaumarchaeota archaeon]|nr:hypothetical protein [Nitrososphaerota archaeon]